jgi:hypothetical protein
MAKRFIDTNLYDDPDFIELSDACQRLWPLLFTKCDNAGVLKYSEAWGKRYRFGDIEALIDSFPADWVCRIGDRKLFLPKFVEFQYGELSENCKPHKQVIELLKKHGLWEGYTKGIHTLKDKDKDKDKGKDKGGVGENFEFAAPSAQSFTEKEVIDAGVMLAIPEDKAREFYHRYNRQGWVLGNGQPIVNLPSALQHYKINQYRFEGKNGDGGKKKLPPLIGKTCTKQGCGLPAVYKSEGEYTNYYCGEHMPEKVKEKYTW